MRTIDRVRAALRRRMKVIRAVRWVAALSTPVLVAWVSYGVQNPAVFCFRLFGVSALGAGVVGLCVLEQLECQSLLDELDDAEAWVTGALREPE